MKSALLAWLSFLLPSLAVAADPIALLVSPEQLVQRPVGSTVLIDVRSESEYESGHLPQARWVNVNDWKQHSLADGGLTERVFWAELVGNLGIARDTSVVVYGGSVTDATRIWWTLKYLGVKHVGILNGGFDAWTDAGAAVNLQLPQIEAVEFVPEFQKDRLADIDEVQSILKNETATVIDTRSDAEYAGTGGPGDRKGHIPGAVHQEWTNFVTADGRFKPVEEIQSLLKAQGLTPDTRAITHCQTGGRASLNAFAMELAGYGPVKNYYCGWSEWSSTPDTPVESP